MFFIRFTHQAAEVISGLLLATAHRTEPRLGLGHLHLLGEVGVDERREVWLVTEEWWLRRAEHPFELVTALKRVVQTILAIGTVIPAFLVVKDATAVSSQPKTQY